MRARVHELPMCEYACLCTVCVCVFVAVTRTAVPPSSCYPFTPDFPMHPPMIHYFSPVAPRHLPIIRNVRASVVGSTVLLCLCVSFFF